MADNNIENVTTENDALDPLALLAEANSTKEANEAEPAEEESAVAKALREKEQNRGLAVNKDEFTSGTEEVTLKNVTETPETEAGVEESLSELDAMIAVAEATNAKLPKDDPVARSTLMMKIAETADNVESGKISVDDLKKNTAANPSYYNDENQAPGPEHADDDDESPTFADPMDRPTTLEVKTATPETVQILIDKTGLGGNVEFTDEERKKIVNATLIKVTEVEDQKIATSSFRRPPNHSFLNTVSKYTLSPFTTPITLPASRYKCSMTGMSYGELNSFIMDAQNGTFEASNKRWSFIYNHLVNPNIGDFESYDDFLKNTAVLDASMFNFGLACSTFPEDDTVEINCKRRSCGKKFNAPYSPRSLIRWDKSSEAYVKHMSETASMNNPEDAIKFHQNSRLFDTNRYELRSGIVVTIGLLSAYDYVNGVGAYFFPDEIKKLFPNKDDATYTSLENTVALLEGLRAIAVPREVEADGTTVYDEYTDPSDILNVLLSVTPADYTMITKIVLSLINSYDVVTGLVDVVCPYCGAKTEFIPLDVAGMVFLRYRAFSSTEIDLTTTL